MNLASLVRYHRRAAGLSQIELAAMDGVSRKALRKLKAGNGQMAWNPVLAVLRVLNESLTPVGPLV